MKATKTTRTKKLNLATKRTVLGVMAIALLHPALALAKDSTCVADRPLAGENAHFLRYSCVTVDQRVFELYQSLIGEKWSVVSRDTKEMMGGTTLGSNGVSETVEGVLKISNKIAEFRIDLKTETKKPHPEYGELLPIRTFKGRVAGLESDFENGKALDLTCVYVY